MNEPHRDLGYEYEPMTAEENQSMLERWFGKHKFQKRTEVDRCAICDQHQLNPMHKEHSNE